MAETKPKIRELHLTNPMMHGQDVKEAQAELIKRGWLRPAVDDGIFGPETAKACHQGKFVLGFPSKLVKPTYGVYFDNILGGRTKISAKWKLTAKKRHRHHVAAATREQQLRVKIVANAKWGVSEKAYIHYEQNRPIEWIGRPRHLPIYTDCSGYVTDCYNWAGAPDPNGMRYNGEGWTGTLLNHMDHITKYMLKPGDVIVYGPYPGRHAVLVGDDLGDDPLVYSNGTEADPNEMRHSVLVGAISSYVTYLTLFAW